MFQAGAEQEWKLGQLNLEAAGKGLFSANNQVSIVSVKAKSALGMPLLIGVVASFLLIIQCGNLYIYPVLPLYNNIGIFCQLIYRMLL